MGKGPGHNNKGKRGHKLSHKTARRAKSVLAPADLMWEAFHAPAEVKVRSAERARLGLCADERSSQSKPLPLDEDLPGMGQFYCDVTGCVCAWGSRDGAAWLSGGYCARRRHFENAAALGTHMKSKEYRKKCVPRPRLHARCVLHEPAADVSLAAAGCTP